jgi:hypothetical protein
LEDSEWEEGRVIGDHVPEAQARRTAVAMGSKRKNCWQRWEIEKMMDEDGDQKSDGKQRLYLSCEGSIKECNSWWRNWDEKTEEQR